MSVFMSRWSTGQIIEAGKINLLSPMISSYSVAAQSAGQLWSESAGYGSESLWVANYSQSGWTKVGISNLSDITISANRSWGSYSLVNVGAIGVQTISSAGSTQLNTASAIEIRTNTLYVGGGAGVGSLSTSGDLRAGTSVVGAFGATSISSSGDIRGGTTIVGALGATSLSTAGAITVSGLVASVSVSGHASRHVDAGADEIIGPLDIRAMTFIQSGYRTAWVQTFNTYANPNTANYEWTLTLDGTGSLTVAGSWNLNTDNIASNRAGIISPGTKTVGTVLSVFQGWKMQVIVSTSYTLNHRLFVGVSGALPTAAEPPVESDAAEFRVVGAAAAGNWYAVCRNSGVETATDTTLTQGASVYTFEIRANTALTGFDFYVNGALNCTITTNLPGATAPFACVQTRTTAARDFQIYGGGVC